MIMLQNESNSSEHARASGHEKLDVPNDGKLLEQFLSRRDQTALSALVDRFGGSVWSVCRRVLARTEDAEDAFQAVFLVLVRSGGKIRNPGAVGSWLYGVAYRTAMKARRDSARRKKHETIARSSPSTSQPPAGAAICRELHNLLDEEVQKLPDKLRDPFVLCCIEGASKGEAARNLELPEGTVSNRLARARQLLKARLTRRGVTLSAVLAALALTQGSSAAPPLLVQSTVTAVSATLAAKSLAGLSPVVVQLANGVARSLVLAKIKLASTLIVAASLAAGGVAVATNQLGQPPAPQAPPAPFGRLITFAGPPAPLLEAVDEQVFALAFSPTGEHLVTAGAGGQLPGQVKIWDVASRQLISKARKIRGTRSIAVSPDGRTLACGEVGGAVTLRDARSGQVLSTLRGHNIGVNSLAYSPDGSALLTAGLDGVIKLWDTKTLTQRKSFRGPEHSYSSIAWFRDGKRFVTGGSDASASIWDRARAGASFWLEGHKAPVDAVAVSPDDKVVATAGQDNAIRLWNADTGAAITTLTGHQSAVHSVAFSPDGSLLAAGSADGAVRLWDAKNYQPMAELGHHAAAVWSVAFAPNGKLLASGSSDATAKLWDVSGNKEVATLATSEMRPVHAAVYSPGGVCIAVAADEGVARIYDTSDGRLITSLVGHVGPVNAIAYSPNGSLVATGGTDKTIGLWDAASGKRKRVLDKHQGPITALAFSPDGARLASGSEDKTVVVWDLNTGEPTRVCTGHSGPVRSVAFGAGGSYVASGGDDKLVCIWDPDRDLEPAKLEGHVSSVRALTFLGPTLLSAGDDGVMAMWDGGGTAPTAKTRPRMLKGPGRIWAVAALGGYNGLISSDDGAILQWNTETGTASGLLMGHSLPITSIAIRPDGKELLSAGLDGRVLRWRPQRERRVIAGPAAPEPAPAKPLEPIKELYQDFRGGNLPKAPLAVFGAHADSAARPDARGFHIVVDANADQSQRIGITLDRPIQNDFEITAGYEIVRADQPEKGHGVGVCLLADLAGTGEVLELMRAGRVNEGQVYGCCRKTVKAGKDNFFAQWFPTTTRAGHLRIVRKGSKLIYSARESGTETFKELFRISCGTEDVKQLRLAAYMGFAPNSIDVYLKDLRVGPPGSAAALAVAEPDELLSDAPVAPTRGRFHLILAGLIAVGLIMAAGCVFLFYRSQRNRANDTADADDARPANVLLVCSSCGKRLLAPPSQFGKTVKCPSCGTRLKVPESAGSDAEIV